MMGIGLCTMCKHYRPGMDNESGVSECRAFPDGIPQELIAGMLTHFEYLEGQRGDVVFEKAEHVDQEDLDAAIDNLDLISAVGMVDDLPDDLPG